MLGGVLMPNFSRIYTTPKFSEQVRIMAAQTQREREWPDTKDRTSEPKPMERK